MKRIMMGVVGACCALIWLVLLIATDFSVLVVGGGLLAGLYLNGTTDPDAHSRPRPGSRSIR